MISVIIPTYKPKEYLFECLTSLDSQTLSKKEYQILIILNGEREPYLSYISKWVSEIKSDIRIYYSENKGVSNARNLGLDKCEGEYVAFIDDDDLVSSQYLESLYSSIKKLPQNAICCSNLKTFDSDGHLGEDYISKAYQNEEKGKNKNVSLDLFRQRKFLSTSWGKLIPLSVIGFRRFDPSYKIGEDSLFMAMISNMISYIGMSSSEGIYYRRIRIGSASRSREHLIKKIVRKSSLISAYIKLYIKNFPNYNFKFYLSRIIAVILG